MQHLSALIKIRLRHDLSNAYISSDMKADGATDKIVTVGGLPASRKVLLLDSMHLTVLRTGVSLNNGHYLFTNLDPAKRYLVMARDLPPNGETQRYEPAVYDYVDSYTDLTIAEQQAMWQQWVDDDYNAQITG